MGGRGMDAARVMTPEALSAIPISGDIQHAQNTGLYLLVRPNDELNLFLHCENGTGRMKVGNWMTLAWTNAEVIVADDTIALTGGTTPHNFRTGDGPLQITTDGTLPNPIVISTDVWVIAVDDLLFKLALTEADAKAGVAIDLTNTGTGNNTIEAENAMLATVTADIINGIGGLEIQADERMVLAAPDRLTVELFGTTPVLTYYWA